MPVTTLGRGGAWSATVALAVATLSLTAPGATANAHAGRTAADGCHIDRKNGGRHCHNGGSKRPTQRPSQLRSGSGTFANCSEARAEGRANIRRGESGYAPHLDRDGDGIACES